MSTDIIWTDETAPKKPEPVWPAISTICALGLFFIGLWANNHFAPFVTFEKGAVFEIERTDMFGLPHESTVRVANPEGISSFDGQRFEVGDYCGVGGPITVEVMGTNWKEVVVEVIYPGWYARRNPCPEGTLTILPKRVLQSTAATFERNEAPRQYVTSPEGIAARAARERAEKDALREQLRNITGE